MYCTQKNHVRCDKNTYRILSTLTHLSKNLYNLTQHAVRQYYFNNGEYLSDERAYHLVKHDKNYHLLPSQVTQQTIKVVDRNMRSFFHVLRERQKGNYNRPARSPKCLSKDGYFSCIFQKDVSKVDDDKIKLSLGRNFSKDLGVRFLEFKFPPTAVGERMKEVRILPRCKGLWFEIEHVHVHEVEPKKAGLDNNSSSLSIDLDLDNFATCVSTRGTPLIIEGRGLKSFNRRWNKEKSKLQSIYDKQGMKMGKKLAWLLRKRKNMMNNVMNQTVSYIIKHCLANSIGDIIVDELKDIKLNMKLGKKNNQNFQYIPYGMFKQKLKAKRECHGMTSHEVDEAYMSHTCSACGDVNTHDRKHGGLHTCRKCGSILNVDVNGVQNILKKVTGESVVRRRMLGSSLVNRPVRIRVVDFRFPCSQPPHEAPSLRVG